MLHKEATLAEVSFYRLLINVLWFCLRTGLGPRYYVVAGMARPWFPPKDKWRHVSARKYYHALEKLNPPAYRKLTQHKVAEKALYQLMQIPTAALIGYYHPHAGFTASGRDLRNVEQLAELLSANKGQRVCFKPVEGWGGTGVLCAEIADLHGEPRVRILPTQNAMPIPQLMSYYDGDSPFASFIVESVITQSQEFHAFNPDSLNTLRVWVLETTPGKSEVIGAYLRVGRAGSSIDNASAGGIMFPIDLQTGEIRPGLTKHTPHRDEITHHPDNHLAIAGHKLKTWPDIIRFSCQVLDRMPSMRFTGLDVSITEEGPILIEANVTPDKDGAAHANIASILIWQVANAN